MTWPFMRERASNLSEVLAERSRSTSASSWDSVSRGSSLTHSAVWAGLRLRADVISSLPVDVFRKINGVQFEVTKPSVLIAPSSEMSFTEWVWASQFDLDSTGNHVSLIVARDALGKPSLLDPVNIDDVTFKVKGRRITKVKVGKMEYDYSEVWHETQYRTSGTPVGLSPIANAARSLGGGLSARDFALQWFGGSAVPGQHLKNINKTLDPAESAIIKRRFKESVTAGDVFVTGNDWELSMLSAKASESAFLEQQSFSLSEVCRFIGVPGDMIDVDSSTGNITYANVTQRNLQLLTMNLGPAIGRREDAITGKWLPAPRFVKFNRGAVLEMDLASRYASYGIGIDKRFLAPSEARALENRPPFTPEQEDEFARLFGGKSQPPVAAKEATA